MTYPTVPVNTTNLDVGTDNPALARTDLLDLAQKFNLLRPLPADLAASTGASLMGWIRSVTGSVATTLAKWLGWQPSNIFEFMTDAQIADVKSGAPSLDHTLAIQAAATACKKLVFGDDASCIFRVSTRIDLHDNSQLDLNGAVINWIGATVNAGNKANKWDNSVFSANLSLAPPSTIKKNIHVKNGTINVNNWGVGVSFKQVEGFSITDLVITNAQCAGINAADCINGEIARCYLKDCAADPASGFVATTDLEYWSDGIILWYGSQNVAINNCDIVNTRPATGRCGVVFEGTSTESGRITSQCSINNCTVRGYDRQLHTELTNHISAYNCNFYFVPTGAKTMSSAVIVWNSVSTTFLACRISSDSFAVTHGGGIRTTFVGCTIESTRATADGELFRNIDNIYSTLKFTDCVLYLKLANAALLNCTANFENCSIQSDTHRLSNFYAGIFAFLNCEFVRTGVSTNYALATDTYNFSNSWWTDLSSVQSCISAPAGALKITINNCEPNGSQIYSEVPTEIIGKNFYYYNIAGGGGEKGWFVNGAWMRGAAPTTLTWKRGDTVLNTIPNQTPYAPCSYGWICTVAGTPGTWFPFGTIG